MIFQVISNITMNRDIFIGLKLVKEWLLPERKTKEGDQNNKKSHNEKT